VGGVNDFYPYGKDPVAARAFERVSEGLVSGALSPVQAVELVPELAPFAVVAGEQGPEFARYALAGAADALGWGLDNIDLESVPGYMAGHRVASGLAGLTALTAAGSPAQAVDQEDEARIEREYAGDVERAVQLAADGEVRYGPGGNVELTRDPYEILAERGGQASTAPAAAGLAADDAGHATDALDDVADEAGWGS
jgi:hypothetical protein